MWGVFTFGLAMMVFPQSVDERTLKTKILSPVSRLLRSDVLIGAPRANTSSPGEVVERGAVYSCPWTSSSACQQLQFDSSGMN